MPYYLANHWSKGTYLRNVSANSRSRRSIRRYQCRNLALQWSHNERYGVSNHRRFECLFNLLFMQRSASLAFVREVHRWLMDSPHKGPGTRKMFPFDDVNMKHRIAVLSYMMDMMILSWENQIMMTSSNGNIFRVTGHLCGEFTGDRWIPRTKSSDAKLWCFFWSASE